MTLRVSTRWAMTALVVAVLWFVVGCATGPPHQRAVDRASAAGAAAADAGAGAVDDIDIIEIRSRYNPCHCPAPDFEVHLRGRWQRVIVDGESQLVEKLYEQARQLEESPGLEVFRLKGELTGSQRFDETGVEYQRFEVLDFRVVIHDP